MGSDIEPAEFRFLGSTTRRDDKMGTIVERWGAEEIEEGRALYKRRVSPELYPKNFYDRALVDILIKAKGHIKSKIW